MAETKSSNFYLTAQDSIDFEDAPANRGLDCLHEEGEVVSLDLIDGPQFRSAPMSVDGGVDFRGAAIDFSSNILSPHGMNPGLGPKMYAAAPVPNDKGPQVASQYISSQLSNIPPEPAAPYIMDRNNHDMPENLMLGNTPERVYEHIRDTFSRFEVDYEFYTDKWCFRAFAYPQSERVQFSVNCFIRNQSQKTCLEFQRFDGPSHLYYTMLSKLKLDMQLIAQDTFQSPLSMPYDDDMPEDYTPPQEEIAAVIEMLADDYENSVISALQLIESLLFNPKAVAPLLQSNVVQAVQQSVEKYDLKEIHRCGCKALNTLANNSDASQRFTTETVQTLLRFARPAQMEQDRLLRYEIQYQAVCALWGLAKNNPEVVSAAKLNQEWAHVAQEVVNSSRPSDLGAVRSGGCIRLEQKAVELSEELRR